MTRWIAVLGGFLVFVRAVVSQMRMVNAGHLGRYQTDLGRARLARAGILVGILIGARIGVLIGILIRM